MSAESRDDGLRALALPSPGTAAGSPIAECRVPVEPALFTRASAFAIEMGWKPDAVAASAWALARARLTGEFDLPFLEARPDADTLLACRVTLPPEASGLQWIAALDAARRSAAPASAGESADCAWCADPDAAVPSLAPLGVGLGVAQADVFARFDPASYDGESVSKFLVAFARAFASLAESPQRPLAEFDMLDSGERKRLFQDWNPPIVERVPSESVASAFRRVAAARADRIAIAWDGGSMTYAALDRCSDALAGRLAAEGVARGEVIGVALDRGVDAVVAILGVLKAGAAYLPIDVRHPLERIAFMLRDAHARRAIALGGDANRFPPGTIVLDAAVNCRLPDGALPPPAPGADDVAYVMYTSGSTGEPKGIEIRHRSILRLALDGNFASVGEDAVVLHAAPLGFDASTFEIWCPLLHGGRCVLHPESVPTGPGLEAAIARHGVSTAWLTSALFNAIVDRNPRHLAGLRELLIGGEALSVPHVRRALDALPGLTIINGYGPTECTTFTCTWRIPRPLESNARSIPIGRPIGGTIVHIVNTRLEPLPPGLVGELVVGGPGLARGYLARPDLNRERFVASPLGGPDGRIYRTGDLARFRADGVIEFIGRRDGQVKIRGFRIETGEIEVLLAAHPAVRASAVVARQDGPGGPRLVAYVVPAGDAPTTASLRAHLARTMPDFMVPSSFVVVGELPVTANGKLDRAALPAPAALRPDLGQAFLAPATAGEETVCRIFSEMLGIDRAGRRDNFFELGGNSLGVIEATERLSRETGREIPTTVFFADPTPEAIAAWIESGGVGDLPASRIAKARADATGREPIAIVAMSGRFPGAASVEAFWDNLREGRESITRFAPDELDPALPASLTGDPYYVAARGVVEGVEQFDAAFFGISPLEARLIDPQQRLFLELCWECLERAGYVPDATPVPVGVFGGMYNSTYSQHHVAAHPEEVARLGAFQAMLGVEKDYIATRTAHRLNLTGPAVSVHTACSTSLVAIVQAVTSLRAGQCDLALAGGASITCPPRSGYLYEEGAMLSPDGHTRTFDEGAQGTVFSDGAAVLLLKRLSDALADGDPIHAVIRGVAVNNDGGAKASFTAPSVEGQAAVIAAALADAGVPPGSISYVETHGTATPLGDPVEVEALARTYGRQVAGGAKLRIGSLKSNVGHLVIAAGAAGVIKAVQSLAHELLPASLHFTKPNPKLALERTPFVVNDRTVPWPRGDEPRRAGVSAFGVGGTNAHVILEEAPAPASRPPACGAELLLVSARTPAALEAAAARLADHLERHADTDLADAAHTLRVGRKAFGERIGVVAGTAAEAATALRRADSPRRATGRAPAAPPAVAFLFPGQGSQYPAMGSRLHAREPEFREAFDACMDALGATEGGALRERLFGGDTASLTQTSLTQPALFALEYAIAACWMARGIRPAALIGHSVGEFVAAAIAGVMAPADAMRLVARRGELMQAMPPGSMLAVRAPASQVTPRLPPGIEVAAENSPGLVVVAGPTPAIESFREALEKDGLTARLLVTSHAFHSAMMDGAVPPFERAVRAVSLSAPAIPIYSTVHARVLDASEAMDPLYWARHLREPVRFGPALVALMASHPGVLLECGPRATLSTLARQQGGKVASIPCASLGDAPDNEQESLLLAAGRLWTMGVPVDLAPRHSRAARRIVLPTYPFERQRHWLDAKAPSPGPMRQADAPSPATQAAPPAVPLPVPGADVPMNAPMPSSRHATLVARLRTLLEDISGLDMAEADVQAPLAELGLDSLTLTQAAIQVKQAFKVNVTFRQIMESHRSIEALAAHLDAQMPADAPAAPAAPAPLAAAVPAPGAMPAMPAATGAPGTFVQEVIRQQMQVMAQQMALLQGLGPAAAPALPASAAPVAPAATMAAPPVAAAPTALVPSEDESPMKRYDVKKAFGAIARIHTEGTELTERQRARLDAFMRRYVARTKRSKAYTEEHRPHMADPRVVNGFRPMIKEIIYQIVIGRSKGPHVWDLDDNRYVDVLNGFGMNLFGWQPDFVTDAVRRQLDLGYEIGPQHPLAGDVAKLVCELTGHDRAGLCNTGSEAVMGAVRIARTVTGRNLIAMFTGSYHGIFDEVIVRATRKHTAVPAAPGIMPNTSQNVLILDYGTPESMAILRERAGELACVLVEPVQSRRPDFQPREFLKELRQVTAEAGSLLVFDEVVTGFRSHPGGIQALFGIRADLCTYGKVMGGGMPIGVIAGKREFMDALDGGAWQYGDDSIPTVGVTYFAGTFVRHPLALAAAKAALLHLKEQGPGLQEALTRRTTAMVEELNDFCRSVGAPIVLKSFASVWKTFFTEDHPLQDLLFAMMRSRGIHILDNFPCFFTTAHGEAEIMAIKQAFRESVIELQESDFIPKRVTTTAFDASKPPVPGARIGKDPDGKPAWYVPNPDAPGKYLRLDA